MIIPRSVPHGIVIISTINGVIAAILKAKIAAIVAGNVVVFISAFQIVTTLLTADRVLAAEVVEGIFPRRSRKAVLVRRPICSMDEMAC